MNRLFVLVTLLIASHSMAAPDDFARGRVVDVTEPSIVQRLTLPPDLYEWTSRPDLGDVRVLNAAQDEVPYAVRRPLTTDEHSPWQTYPLFVLPTSDNREATDARVRIDVDDGGAIIAIRDTKVEGMISGGAKSEGRKNSADDEGAASFLVDASSMDQAATEMQIDWETSDEADFVGTLRIEVSDDLNSWRSLIRATTIANLSSGDHEVRLDRIELPRTKERYLKITQVDGSARVSLSNVQLRYRESQLPDRQWKSLGGVSVDDGHEFESGGLFPTDRLVLQPADSSVSYLVEARFYSRAKPDEMWRSRGEHTFYRTTINGIVVEADPLSIAYGDQYWRVELDDDGLISPVLRIGWLPDELIFLTQGEAPFVLAYGQAGMEGRPWPLQQLLDKLATGREHGLIGDVSVARTGAAEMLGGPNRLKPRAEPIDWRTVILWAVLLAGVIVVGSLAFRLLRS